jgi:DNA-binding NarL/FixJ family response regulator
MARLLIADDHEIVRRGLVQILEADSAEWRIEEVASGQEVLERISAEEYDLLILDISLPGLTGLEVLKEVRRRRPELPVLMLTMHPEEQYAIRSLRAGAAGYLTKDADPQEMIAAIRKVAAGGRFIRTSLAERLAHHLEEGMIGDSVNGLSDREFQVMLMLARGMRVKQIAEELGLSDKTVSTYRARILRKMGLTENADLTRFALVHGLIE